MTTGIEFFGGGPDATLISTTNSTISFQSGANQEFDTGQSFLNGTSLRIPSTGAASYVRWDGVAGTTQISVSLYCRFASVNPSGAQTILAIRDNAGASLVGLVIRTTGRLAAVNNAGSVITANGGTDIAAHLLTANNWYRVDLLLTVGTSTTGRVQYRIIDVQNGDNNIPITTPYDSGASQNLGTTNIDRIYLGAVGAQTNNGDYNYGIFRWETGKTDFYDQYTDAIKSVNSQQGTSLSAASNLVLPGGADSGDLVIYFISSDNTGGTAISAVGGSGGGSAWQATGSTTVASNVLEGRAFGRVLTGTTGDNILNPGGAAEDYTAIGVCIFADKHSYVTGGLFLYTASVNSASSSAVDPATISPVPDGEYTWLVWGAIDKSVSGDTISVPPANYINLFGSNSAAAGTSTAARLAYRRLTAASDNPGTFTNTSRPWVSIGIPIAMPQPGVWGVHNELVA